MPRRVDHDERRREITHAVWLLMASGGPAAVTLRAVAAEAGVSVGRIQHYFATKEDLVRHGCRAMIEGAVAMLPTSLDADDAEGADPFETLRYLVTHAVPTTEPFRTGTAVWVAYLAMSVGDPEIARLVADAKRGAEEFAVRLLGEGIAAGWVRRDLDLRTAARRLLATADGLGLRVLVGDLPAADAVRLLDADLAALGGGEGAAGGGDG